MYTVDIVEELTKWKMTNEGLEYKKPGFRRIYTMNHDWLGWELNNWTHLDIDGSKIKFWG